MLAAWIGALSHVMFDLVSGAQHQARLAAFSGTREPAARRDGRSVAHRDLRGRRSRVMGAAAPRIHRRDQSCCGDRDVPRAQRRARWPCACRSGRRQRAPTTIVRHAVEASWGSLTEWNVFDRTPHALRKWRVDALGNARRCCSRYRCDTDAPARRGVAIARHGQKFSRVHDLGFAVDDSARTRRHASAVVGYPLLPVRSTPAQEHEVVRAVVRRNLRPRRAATQADCSRGTRGCRPGLPSSREAKQMIRKGRACARWCASTSRPCREKHSRHSPTVRNANV